MKYKILLSTILLSSTTVFAQQKSTISGQVTGEGKFLAGAVVSLTSVNKTITTNSKGEYVIENLNEGFYPVSVSYAGFLTLRDTLAVTDARDFVYNFDLKDDALELEGLIITATRNVVPKYNAPVIVNTISGRTFETTQSLSISEGLNFSPGLRMENNCQNCGFNQLRMNGLEGPYSQILINSRPIFSALAGVYGLEMLPANMVDRVEVVRGGGSVLYGGNAIAGTVNIITKDPVTNSFEVGINQSFIDFSTPDRTISFNGSIVSEELDKGLTFFGYNRSRSPYDANEDGFSEITKLKNNTFGFDAFWNTSERSKLKLGLYSISEFRRGGDGFDLAPHQSNITEQLDHNIISTNLSFEQYSKDFKHKISVYGSAQFVDRKSYYGAGGRVLKEGDELTEEDIIALNAYGLAKDASLVGGVQYNYNINEQLNLTAGTEYQYNQVEDEMKGYERWIEQKVGTSGTYAQLEYKPLDKLTLLAGGRFDLVNIKGTHVLGTEEMYDNQSMNVFVPRLSAMYEINDVLKARFSYAQGYRAPQAFDEDLHVETVGGDVRFIRMSDDLIMEKSNSFNASLNYAKTVGSTQMNFVAEGFYTHLDNPFIFSDQTELPNGMAVITKRNGEGAIVSGINLEANFAIGSKFIVQSGVTLQTAKYTEEEELWTPEDESDSTPATVTNRLLRTPNAYGFYTVSYSPIKPMTLSYSGVITGTMDVPHVIDPDTEQTVIKHTPSFFEHNIKAAYTIDMQNNYRIQLSAGIQNMFNSYQKDFDRGITRDANYVYGPSRPRTLFMGLKIGLN